MNCLLEFLKRGCRFAFPVLLLSVLAVSLAPWSVQAAESISLSWVANPVEDNIVGYRLYYGTRSRYTDDGRLAANFYYDYYLDFTSWERCSLATGEPVCETIADGDVSCVDLYGESPQCTVYNFQGSLFFAMTAYSSQAESDYTQELFQQLGSTVSPAQLGVLQQVYSLLLH
jgi:hypothetical protein